MNINYVLKKYIHYKYYVIYVIELNELFALKYIYSFEPEIYIEVFDEKSTYIIYIISTFIS